ncbi:MAG: hypothetical protein DMG93_04845 [Acidobacteria bacterium]|nr:MAG: hypothetical protein DMG93_04845 [Acidobacteriota bacterium]
MTSSTKRVLRVWFPSVTWLAVIALESTNLGLCRTYWADSVSDLSFCVRNGFGEFCGLLLSTSLVAILDEWHQTFLLSRTGAFRDVILDSTAGLVAQIAIFTMLRTLVSHD